MSDRSSVGTNALQFREHLRSFETSTCTDLYQRVQQWCQANNVYFTTSLNQVSKSGHTGKIVYMWLGDLLPGRRYWQDLNQTMALRQKTLFVITDNFLDFEDLSNIKFHSDPTLHAIFNHDQNPIVKRTPAKLFNCFIHRVCSVRQSWFYFLHLKDLLDKGYVSFLLYQLEDYSQLTGKELFDYNHFHFGLDKLPNFRQAYLDLRDQVPFKNFSDNYHLNHYIQDSKYSLVLETYAVDDDTERWCTTEKTIRALCNPSIPLLFMQKKAVTKLCQIGFMIPYHDHIDNEDWISRQKKLLDMIEHDVVDYNYKHLYNMAMHNRDICSKFEKQRANKNYFAEFFTKVIEH